MTTSGLYQAQKQQGRHTEVNKSLRIHTFKSDTYRPRPLRGNQDDIVIPILNELSLLCSSPDPYWSNAQALFFLFLFFDQSPRANENRKPSSLHQQTKLKENTSTSKWSVRHTHPIVLSLPVVHPFTLWHHDSERSGPETSESEMCQRSCSPQGGYKEQEMAARLFPRVPLNVPDAHEKTFADGARRFCRRRPRAPTAVRGNEGQRGTQDGGEQLVSIVFCQRKVLPSYCCSLIGWSCQHVCLGGTRCQWLSGPLCRQHTATHKLTMWARVTLLPTRIMFPRLSRPTHCDCWMSEVLGFFFSPPLRTVKVLYLSLMLQVLNWSSL